MKAEGKTVLAVHHDLQTVPDYSTDDAPEPRLVAFGPTGDATPERLHETYGDA
jgi:manganese/zinc/iron transport system ATP- binding protein